MFVIWLSYWKVDKMVVLELQAKVKPMTTVHVCVLVFVHMKTWYFWVDIRTVPTYKDRYFKTEHDLFLTLTKRFLCLNLTRAKAQHCHKLQWHFTSGSLQHNKYCILRCLIFPQAVNRLLRTSMVAHTRYNQCWELHNRNNILRVTDFSGHLKKNLY